ncbi:SPOR domain-containing protein [Streptomyces canus]|uniref:SPOR domain-containing protein n=1 Tax=Streptomyces canus TaxID=58343 RepID=UPI002251BF77|nr:SPOR domain-containing protein [Streptomyces canus]MCX4856615.1 SPOR domain-containing protein [Streptomyces canus]
MPAAGTESPKSNVALPWLVIRQDEQGNRYRVGRYATRAEAERVADSLNRRPAAPMPYSVERTSNLR